MAPREQYEEHSERDFEEQWYAAPLKEPMTMPVPASYNDLKEGVDFRDHYGWVFYQRKISVPAFVRDQRVVLRCAAVWRRVRPHRRHKKVTKRVKKPKKQLQSPSKIVYN